MLRINPAHALMIEVQGCCHSASYFVRSLVNEISWLVSYSFRTVPCRLTTCATSPRCQPNCRSFCSFITNSKLQQAWDHEPKKAIFLQQNATNSQFKKLCQKPQYQMSVNSLEHRNQGGSEAVPVTVIALNIRPVNCCKPNPSRKYWVEEAGPVGCDAVSLG
jgi:hypothetical protein